MDARFVLPDRLIITLEVFWREQFVAGEPTIALRTLEDMAAKGRLPGAFRPSGSRQWWVNKLALLQEGLNSHSDGTPEETSSEAHAPQTRERRRGEGRRPVPRSKDDQPPSRRWPAS